jgi:hypothetical protein
MPKIFEYFGFIFYFYSNEHAPIHVHVAFGEFESIFELIMEDGKLVEIKQRKKKGVDPLTEKDAKIATKFIRYYSTEIVSKWIKFFVMKQVIQNTKITKKI